MKLLPTLTLFLAMITGLFYCMVIGIEKQARIDDLYGWRCCHKGEAYRKIDLMKKDQK